MKLDTRKYPIKGIVLEGQHTRVLYQDNTTSGGIHWCSMEAALSYCKRVGLPVTVK